MPQISGSGSLSDNEMNIVWFNPAVGTSNQQTMRRGDDCSRGNERAGTEAQVSVRHVDPSNGRPGPFPGGYRQSVAWCHQGPRLAGSRIGGSRDVGGRPKWRSAITERGLRKRCRYMRRVEQAECQTKKDAIRCHRLVSRGSGNRPRNAFRFRHII